MTIARTEVDGLTLRASHANADTPHVAIATKEPLLMMQHEQCDERGEPARVGRGDRAIATVAIAEAARHAMGPQ